MATSLGPLAPPIDEEERLHREEIRNTLMSNDQFLALPRAERTRTALRFAQQQIQKRQEQRDWATFYAAKAEAGPPSIPGVEIAELPPEPVAAPVEAGPEPVFDVPEPEFPKAGLLTDPEAQAATDVSLPMVEVGAPERIAKVVAGVGAKYLSGTLGFIGQNLDRQRSADDKLLRQFAAKQFEQGKISVEQFAKVDATLIARDLQGPGAFERVGADIERFAQEQEWAPREVEGVMDALKNPDKAVEHLTNILTHIGAYVGVRALGLHLGASPMGATALTIGMRRIPERGNLYRAEINRGTTPETANLIADTNMAVGTLLDVLIFGKIMQLGGGGKAVLAKNTERFARQIATGQKVSLPTSQIIKDYAATGAAFALLGQAGETVPWVIDGRKIPEGMLGRRVVDVLTGIGTRGLFGATGQLRIQELRNGGLWMDAKGNMYAHNFNTGQTFGFNPKTRAWTSVASNTAAAIPPKALTGPTAAPSGVPSLVPARVSPAVAPTITPAPPVMPAPSPAGAVQQPLAKQAAPITEAEPVREPEVTAVAEKQRPKFYPKELWEKRQAWLSEHKGEEPDAIITKHDAEPVEDEVEPGDILERVVFEEPGQETPTNDTDAVGLTEHEHPSLKAIHVSGDTDYWIERLAEDYDRDPADARIIRIRVGEGDVLVEDPQYAMDPEGGMMADSAILVTKRATLRRGIDFVVGDELFIEQAPPAPSTPPPTVAETPTTQAAPIEVEQAFPIAGDTVDGRIVREDVPNLSSIEATIESPEELAGVREVPFSAFTLLDPVGIKPDKATRELAARIQESGELNPLIVGIDEVGPYIIEGAHRFDALLALGAKSFPAIVVLEPGVTTTPALLAPAKPSLTPPSTPAVAAPKRPEAPTGVLPTPKAPEVAKREPGRPVTEGKAKVEEVAEKQPWEMTKEKFHKTEDLILHKPRQVLHRNTIPKEGPWRITHFFSPDHSKAKGKENVPAYHMDYPDYRSARAAFDMVFPPTHKTLVEQALAEGKPVPSEVLAEYPDLTLAERPPEVAVEPKAVTKPELTYVVKMPYMVKLSERRAYAKRQSQIAEAIRATGASVTASHPELGPSDYRVVGTPKQVALVRKLLARRKGVQIVTEVAPAAQPAEAEKAPEKPPSLNIVEARGKVEGIPAEETPAAAKLRARDELQKSKLQTLRDRATAEKKAGKHRNALKRGLTNYVNKVVPAKHRKRLTNRIATAWTPAEINHAADSVIATATALASREDQILTPAQLEAVAERYVRAGERKGWSEGVLDVKATQEELIQFIEEHLPISERGRLLRTLKNTVRPELLEKAHAAVAKVYAVWDTNEAIKGFTKAEKAAKKMRGGQRKHPTVEPFYVDALDSIFDKIRTKGITKKTRETLEATILADDFDEQLKKNFFRTPKAKAKGKAKAEELQGNVQFQRAKGKAGEKLAEQARIWDEGTGEWVYEKPLLREMDAVDIRAMTALVQRIMNQAKQKKTIIKHRATVELATTAVTAAEEIHFLHTEKYGEKVGERPIEPSLAKQTLAYDTLSGDGLADVLGPTSLDVIYRPVSIGNKKAKRVVQDAEDALDATMAENGIDLKTRGGRKLVFGMSQAAHNQERKWWDRLGQAIGTKPKAQLFKIKLPANKQYGWKAETLEIDAATRMTMLATFSDPDSMHELTRRGGGGITVWNDSKDRVFNLDMARVQTIIDSATETEKNIVAGVKQHLNGPLKNELNEAWVEFPGGGYEIALNDDYFPRRRNQDTQDAGMSVGENPLGYVREATLAGMPMFKERTGSNKPVVMGDFFAMYVSHVEAVSAFVGMATPLHNATKFINTVAVKKAITATLGNPYFAQIQQWIKDATGQPPPPGEAQGKILRWWRSFIVKGILRGRVRIMVQQAFSYPLVAIELGMYDKGTWKGIAKGLPHILRTTKEEIEEVKRWWPDLRERAEGGAARLTSPGMRGTGMLGFLFGNKPSLGLGGIRWVDTKTVLGGAKKATEWKVLSDAGKTELFGTPMETWPEDIRMKLLDRVTEVTNRTQPTFDPITMPAIARRARDNPYLSLLTAFTSYTSKVQNMGRRVVRNVRQNKSTKSQAVGELAALFVMSVMLKYAYDNLWWWLKRGRKEEDPDKDTLWAKGLDIALRTIGLVIPFQAAPLRPAIQTVRGLAERGRPYEGRGSVTAQSYAQALMAVYRWTQYAKEKDQEKAIEKLWKAIIATGITIGTPLGTQGPVDVIETVVGAVGKKDTKQSILIAYKRYVLDAEKGIESEEDSKRRTELADRARAAGVGAGATLSKARKWLKKRKAK